MSHPASHHRHNNLTIAHPAVVMNGKAIKTITDFIRDMQSPHSELHKLIENNQLNAAKLRETIRINYCHQAILVACQKEQEREFLAAKILTGKKATEQAQELSDEESKAEQAKLAEMARADQQERNAAAAAKAAETARLQAKIERIADKIAELAEKQTAILANMVTENQTRVDDIIEKTKDNEKLKKADLSIKHKNEKGETITTSFAPGTQAAAVLLKGMVDTSSLANTMTTSRTKRAAMAARTQDETQKPVDGFNHRDAMIATITHDSQLIRELLNLHEEATVLPSHYKSLNQILDAYIGQYNAPTNKDPYDRLQSIHNNFNTIETLCQNQAVIQSLQSKLDNYCMKIAPTHNIHQANLFYGTKNIHDVHLEPISKPRFGGRS